MNISDFEMSYMNPSLPAKTIPKAKRKFKKRNTFKNALHLNLEHREKERIRHQTINEQIEKLCQLVPKTEGKQTKVRRLQRVLSYCCYLESTVEKLSQELEITIPQEYKLVTPQSLNDIGFNHSEEPNSQINEVTTKDYGEECALNSGVAYPFSFVNTFGWNDPPLQEESNLTVESQLPPEWHILPNILAEDNPMDLLTAYQ